MPWGFFYRSNTGKTARQIREAEERKASLHYAAVERRRKAKRGGKR